MADEIDLNQGIKGKYSKLKLAHHPEKLRSFIEGKITPPIYVRIKPTNICNHKCFYCVYEEDFSGMHDTMDRISEIPKPKMDEILEDLKEMGVKAVTYSGGGEPLVYPHIAETLQKTLDNNLKLSIITNGQLLLGKSAELLAKAHWVRVSIDSCDGETFSKIRGKPPSWFDQIKENMTKFAQIKDSKCALQINFVVHEHNFDKIYQSAKLFKEIGVENIRFSPLWNPNMHKYHAPFKQQAIEQINKSKEELTESDFEIGSSYERDFEISGGFKRRFPKCYFMQIVPAIGADQKVYFCHNKAYDNSGVLGSIKDKSFKELWFSEEAKEKFRNFDPRKSCYHQCSNDEKNRIINEMIAAGDPRVVDFV